MCSYIFVNFKASNVLDEICFNSNLFKFFLLNLSRDFSFERRHPRRLGISWSRYKKYFNLTSKDFNNPEILLEFLFDFLVTKPVTLQKIV